MENEYGVSSIVMGYVIETEENKVVGDKEGSNKVVAMRIYPTTEKYCCILGVVEIDKECYGSCHHKVWLNGYNAGLWSRKAISWLFRLSGRCSMNWH